MSRYSDYPDHDDVLDEDPDSSGPVVDVDPNDCSGTDWELQVMLKQLEGLIGKREFAFKVRFAPGKVTAVKINFLEAEKVQITTVESSAKSHERHYMVLPMNADALDSNRTHESVPEIGIARSLLRLLQKNGN